MISIVIPTLNEACHLPAALLAISANEADAEVIVVDAGSTDRTAEQVEERGVRLIHSKKQQRAAQMNLGAEFASGTTLLFLHADTLLSPVALTRIAATLYQYPSVAGGGFARYFDSDSSFLRATCLLAELRTRYTGWFLGDQAMFVRRAVFEKLGGFREVGLFEDLDLALRMRSIGRTVTLRPPVISSARRFEREGAWRRTWADFRLTWNYLRQVKRSAQSIATANTKSVPSAAAEELGSAATKFRSD